ncbi:cell wall-binding repeat-containing protein [Finegoldia magna]|uniref:cell wall-binding repeat-containing protein n=1 Tax=Finegoldia magna TaxID=1260 RepID=UPI00290820C3|nr:cell wall-binding repeat-containing protein [Finegoldia magna]MDU5508177.1 cell wall-binding repeat-containing protein [Finegoldia magna]
MNLKKNLVKCTVALSLATMLTIPTNGLAYKEARIGGHDRFDVAINISKEYENSDTCYLINYLAYPDAIASSNYIKDSNGKYIPIYYTKSDQLDAKTLNHLKAKKHKEVVIFGGEKSVSNKVIQQLQNNGFKVSRSSAGRDRYDTVNQLLKGSTNYQAENIILVSGENFADSLIGTSLAKKLNCKIIITPHNKIDETIKNEFFNTNKKQRAKVNNVYIVGGEKSISKNIEQQFSTVAKVHRMSGRDRYDTSLQLAKEIGNDKYTVVSGENFADNLVAIPYSYTNNSTIVLTSSKSISNNLKSLIKNKDFTIVGGEKSVPNTILELLKKDSLKPDDKKEPEEQKKQEESEDKNNPKEQEKQEDKDKKEEQTKPNEQGKKEYKPDIDGVIIDSELPGNEEWKDIIIELKGIAKDAVAFGNGDDKKTVEYIIKWIHNHTEYDKRVYEGGNFNGYPLEWYRDWVKNNRKVGRGVCNVYADLFRYICGYADIPNKKIEASLFSVDQYDHALNVVKINNEWLYFDLTNSDGVYDSDPRSTNKYDMIFATREQISFLYKKLENPVLN